MPLTVRMKEKERRNQETRGTRRIQEKDISVWNKEAVQKYMENMEEICESIDWIEEETIEEKWQRIKEVVTKAMIKKRIKIKTRHLGHKDWWDRCCTRKKRSVHRMYRNWRRGRIDFLKYWDEKRNVKELFQKKQKEKREEEEEDLKNIRKDAEVWKFINKKRGKKSWIENNIDNKTWRDHFKNLLDCSDRSKEVEDNGKIKLYDDILKEEEIRKAVQKLKIRKAAGVDGIPMEAWKYASISLWKRFVDLIRQIWKEGIRRLEEKYHHPFI